MEIFKRELKTKGIIRDPMDPLFLSLVGELDISRKPNQVPVLGVPWTQTYHIFCNQGSWDRNYSMGLLQLEAPNGASLNECWNLKGKKLLYDGINSHRSGSGFSGEAAVDRFDFEVSYNNGILEQWKTRQAIVCYHGKSSGKEFEKTILSKSGFIEDGNCIVRTGSSERRRPLPEDKRMCTVADALVYSQLWPFAESFSEEVCILEELSIPKGNGLVYYDGSTDDCDHMILHTFVLQGKGMIPLDFWVDSQHRLVASIMGSFGLAYVPVERSKRSFRPFLQAERDRHIEL